MIFSSFRPRAACAFSNLLLLLELVSVCKICNDTVGISEHGQATSGILFNFRVSSGGISSGVHHHVQDYKRSSSWNTDHGSVETLTCIQKTPIASGSFIVVYQSNQTFENYLLKLFS